MRSSLIRWDCQAFEMVGWRGPKPQAAPSAPSNTARGRENALKGGHLLTIYKEPGVQTGEIVQDHKARISCDPDTLSQVF